MTIDRTAAPERDVEVARPRRWRRWAASVALSAVVVAVTVVWLVVRDDGPRWKVGSVLPVSGVETSEHSYVQVPWGRLDLAVSEPVGAIPPPAEAATKHAPDGGSFLGVTFAPHPDGVRVIPGTSTGVIRPARVTLVAGGHRYSVGAVEAGTIGVVSGVLLTEHELYVAVPGHPRDATFSVEYDGVTQTVDPRSGHRVAGRAAPLYADGRLTGDHSCGAPAWQVDFAGEGTAPTCRTSADREPYVAGLGWAAPGRTWVLARSLIGQADHVVRTVSGGRQTYDVDPGQILRSYQLSGGTLTALDAFSRSGPMTRPDTAVFSVPADGTKQVLTVQVTYSLRLQSSAGRPRALAEGVQATWTVTT